MGHKCKVRDCLVGQVPFADRTVHQVCLECGEDLGPISLSVAVTFDNGICAPPSIKPSPDRIVTVSPQRLVELKGEAAQWHPVLRRIIEAYPVEAP
ncbi:MAG TPA: hypothetical protein VF747_07980 [Blastocatellia bacterium]|jgi:hypothetical protein